jgi:hypothetical protein
MLIEQLLLPLVLSGLLVLVLIMPSFARRFQQREAVRRSVVQRMESWIRQVESALERLQRLPLDGAVYRVLRRDTLDRYQMIGRVFRSYPGLAERIAEIQDRLRGEAEAVAGPVPVVMNEAECNRLQAALDDLTVFLDNPGTLHPIPPDLRDQIRRHLQERRAELLAQHHLAHYREALTAGDRAAGEARLRRLAAWLQSEAPATPRVEELRREAQRLLHRDQGSGSDADARQAS